MGLGSIGIWQLVIILVIVILLFGTKRLKNIGGDLGSAFKGFKNAMNDDEPKKIENNEQDAKFSQETTSEKKNTQDSKAEK